MSKWMDSVDGCYDSVSAYIDKNINPHLIDIEIQGDHAECVSLTKTDAKAFGEYLIALSEKIDK